MNHVGTGAPACAAAAVLAAADPTPNA